MKLDLEFIPIIMDKKLSFISNGSSGQSTGTTSSLAPTPHDKWVHFAMVKTPTQLRLYTDGVLK